MDDSTLKAIQFTELNILKDVAKVCDDNNITYFLTCGTLLGAVRHQGFIPWDDDLDICMPYDDYRKFLNVAQMELGEKYFVQTYQTDLNWYRPHAKVRLNGTAMIEKNLTRYHIHQGIWIDIFPLIRISNKLEFCIKKHLITFGNYLQAQDYIDSHFDNTFTKLKRSLVGCFLYLIYRIPISRRMKIHDSIIGYVCSNKKGNYISELWSNITHMYPADIFDGNGITYPFCKYTFVIPSGWKEYLTIKYGDYMELPPLEKRTNHNVGVVDFDKSYVEYIE